MINPFGKSIKDLEPEDLQKLIEKNFCESIFIEYKSGMPEPKKIAKAIAGFANSHGGYLIIGTDKDCGKDEVPKSFPGTTMNAKPKDHIKNICRDHISPIPMYEVKYLEPGGSKGILVIQIEDSLDTPHINRDGKIYRRESNSTESVPEDSRGAIDYLYQKGLSGQGIIDDYLRKKEDHFESEKCTATLNIFFIEIIICPIPIRELITDLFNERVQYEQQLPLLNRAQGASVDIDCIYHQNGLIYEELDVNGCLSLHYGEEASLGKETNPQSPVSYFEKWMILPVYITSCLHEGIKAANNIYQMCSQKGFDHFGKIRIKISLRNVRSKVLYYADERHYRFTEDLGCRNRDLKIPPYDCYISDLEKPGLIIEEVLKHVKRGFNLPF